MSYDGLDIESTLQRVDALRREVETERPISEDKVGKALQRLRLEWTYHSNAIEGNSLTYGETRALLLHGVTAQGKPLKDHLDIRGHREALDFLERFVRDEEALTLAAIRELHKMLLGDEPYEIRAETPDGSITKRTITPGAFKTRPNHVRTETGEIHYYGSPEETPALMQDLVDWYRETWPQVETGEVHPLPFAADLHHRFVAIHPFDDGNGRLGRLLMNLVLMRAGYVPAVVRQERRSAYYGALAQADAADLAPLIRFLGEELAATMQLYLSALRGDPDPDEFDRRLALLSREVKTREVNADEQWGETLVTVSQNFLVPLLNSVKAKVRSIEELFHEREERLYVFLSDGTETYTEDALLGGKWTSFALSQRFKGHQSYPMVSLSWMLKGQVVTDGVKVVDNISMLGLPSSCKSRMVQWRFDYDAKPGQAEAQRFEEELLSRLMDLLERGHRMAAKQSRIDPPAS